MRLAIDRRPAFRTLFTAVLLGLGGTVVLAADVITKSDRLPSFREVAINVPGDVKLTAGAQTDYTITAEPLVVSAISFKVSGQKLTVSTIKNFESKKPITITIRLPSLAKLDTNGSVNLTSSVPTAEDSFELRMDGASDVNLDAVQTKFSKITLSGSGTVAMSGRSDKLILVLSGSADGKLKNLKTQEADVAITGSGDVTVAVARQLKAAITGAGEINYVGSPKVESKISGAGDVRQLK